MGNQWIIATKVDVRYKPSPEDHIVGPQAAMEAIETAIKTPPADGLAVRVVDPRNNMRWMDVAACEWGWALLYNAPDEGHSFCTWAGGRQEMRSFQSTHGEEIELDRRWFVPPPVAREALGRYLSTERLWTGVAWWPELPDELRTV